MEPHSCFLQMAYQTHFAEVVERHPKTHLHLDSQCHHLLEGTMTVDRKRRRLPS